MQRIILFFGSFNPIHRGHLSMAESVLEQNEMAELWFVVSPQNPFKNQSDLAPETDRLQMTELAIAGSPMRDRLRACSIEFDLPRPSRTIDTLHTMTKQYPDRQFILLIGSDNVDDFDRWKNYEKILNHYTVWVYPREGYTPQKQPIIARMTPLTEVPLLPQAATDIRHHHHARTQLSTAVWNYILEHKLYGFA